MCVYPRIDTRTDEQHIPFETTARRGSCWRDSSFASLNMTSKNGACAFGIVHNSDDEDGRHLSRLIR